MEETPGTQTNPSPPQITNDNTITTPKNFFKLFLPDSLWTILLENTNANAESHPSPANRSRPWKPVTFEEIMVFTGALIYMNTHIEPSTDIYWRNSRPPFHEIPKYIGLVRFEQIKRFFCLGIGDAWSVDNTTSTTNGGGECDGGAGGATIQPRHLSDTDLTPQDETVHDADYAGESWWPTVEPMVSSFRAKCKALYHHNHNPRSANPEPEPSIDKVIDRHFGRPKSSRSASTCKVPDTPAFLRVVETAVLNAHRVESILRKEGGLPKISQLDFRERLYDELFGYRPSPRTTREVQVSPDASRVVGAVGSMPAGPRPPPPELPGIPAVPRPTLPLQQQQQQPAAQPTKKRKTKASDIHLPPQRLNRSLQHTLRQRPLNDRSPCIWCKFTTLQLPRYAPEKKNAYVVGWNCEDCKVPVCHPKSGRLCWRALHCIYECV